jgi:hypothetical protein
MARGSRYSVRATPAHGVGDDRFQGSLASQTSSLCNGIHGAAAWWVFVLTGWSIYLTVNRPLPIRNTFFLGAVHEPVAAVPGIGNSGAIGVALAAERQPEVLDSQPDHAPLG